MLLGVRPVHPALVLLGASVLWGLSWLPLKYFATFDLKGVAVTLVAYGSVGLLGAARLLSRGRVLRAHLGGLAMLAGVGGLANLSFASAIGAGDVVRVMVLFYLLPAWGALGGWLWLGERIDAPRKLAVASALLGAGLILGGPQALLQPPSLTDVLAVTSGLALALNNVWFRKLDDVSVADKVASMFAGCLLWALALWALGVQPLPSGVPLAIWLELAGFGLVWLLVATIGTQWGVAHLEAGTSSVLIIMELVSAVASAALLSGARLRPIEWFGGALIMLAAVIEARRAARA